MEKFYFKFMVTLNTLRPYGAPRPAAGKELVHRGRHWEAKRLRGKSPNGQYSSHGRV